MVDSCCSLGKQCQLVVVVEAEGSEDTMQVKKKTDSVFSELTYIKVMYLWYIVVCLS